MMLIHSALAGSDAIDDAGVGLNHLPRVSLRGQRSLARPQCHDQQPGRWSTRFGLGEGIITTETLRPAQTSTRREHHPTGSTLHGAHAGPLALGGSLRRRTRQLPRHRARAIGPEVNAAARRHLVIQLKRPLNPYAFELKWSDSRRPLSVSWLVHRLTNLASRRNSVDQGSLSDFGAIPVSRRQRSCFGSASA